jgi:hypothetical protein
MLDPMTSRLAQIQYQERLQAAEQARTWRAARGTPRSWHAQAGLALGNRLIAWGHQLQTMFGAPRALTRDS